MLKRARIWAAVAMVLVLYGSCGLFPQTGGLATIGGYIALGFAVLSLLLSLFDEPPGMTNRSPESESGRKPA